jgi:hypothetical protein
VDSAEFYRGKNKPFIDEGFIPYFKPGHVSLHNYIPDSEASQLAVGKSYALFIDIV